MGSRANVEREWRAFDASRQGHGAFSRRDVLALAGSAALTRPVRAFGARSSAPPAIDAAQLRRRLERLSLFGRLTGGTFASGVSRVAYSDADVAARACLLDEIRRSGFTPRTDPAGNIFPLDATVYDVSPDGRRFLLL